MKPALIVFDFDGTLVNTFPLVQEYLDSAAPQLSAKTVKKLRGENYFRIAWELIRRRVNIFNLFRQGQASYNRLETEAIHVQPQLAQQLLQLYQQGHKLCIASSSNQHIIEMILRQDGLIYIFVEIFGSQGIFNKDECLRHLRNQFPNLNQYIYVGDELRDVSAAQAAGFSPLSVTWGYARREGLVARNPNYIDEPSELLSKVESMLSPAHNPTEILA